MRRRVVACAAALVAVTMLVSPETGHAQTSAPADRDTLADRQAIIGDRVKRLEDRMFQLARALKTTDPDKASRLLEGLGALREKGLELRIVEIVRLLGEHQLVDAADAQVGVESQLQAILKLLMEDTYDLEKQREEMERIEKIRQRLDDLLGRQREAKQRAESALAQTRLAEALDDAAHVARDLLERQEGLNAERGRGGANGARPAETQAELRGETEALARDVAEVAEKLRAAAEAADALSEDESDKSETEKPAGDGPSGEQLSQGASPSGAPAEKNGSSEESGASGSADSASSKETSGGGAEAEAPAEKAEAAAGHLDEAADAMRSAEDTLRSAADAEAATDRQAEAVEDLKKAIDELEAEAKDIRNRLKLEEDAEKQRALAEESSKLLDGMRGESPESGSESGDKSGDDEKQDEGDQSGQSQKSGGEQSGGESGQSSSGSGEQGAPQTPGERPLEEAIPHQQDAAKDLDDHLPDEAAEDQQKAIDKLEEAREDLEERLDQLRREQQEQLLAALESRFRGMLSRQLEVNKATDRLIDLGVDNWKRSDQLELAELSEKQRWVGDEADEAMFLLKEEGSTVVLPPLLEIVRDDARHVADRLAAAHADRATRIVQTELESVLRDMIEAIKKQQEEMEQGGGGGGGGGGNPPLLPGSAELKLLRACQIRINTTTEALHGELAAAPDEAVELRVEISRLATKQDNVAKMARSMHESLRKAQ